METPYRSKFRSHRYNAKIRGIPFLFSFEEWLAIWQNSGHLHQRGCKRGQYVMARFGDKGPYAIGNVKIVLSNTNNSEAKVGNKYGVKNKGMSGKKHKPESIAKMRGNTNAVGNKYWLGKKRPEQSRKMLGNKFGLGHKLSPEHKAKLLASHKKKQH